MWKGVAKQSTKIKAKRSNFFKNCETKRNRISSLRFEAKKIRIENGSPYSELVTLFTIRILSSLGHANFAYLCMCEQEAYSTLLENLTDDANTYLYIVEDIFDHFPLYLTKSYVT